MAKSKLIDTLLLQRFWDGFKDKLHIHSNDATLNATTASYTTEEKAKLDSITIDTDGCLYNANIRINTEINSIVEPNEQIIGDFWLSSYE